MQALPPIEQVRRERPDLSDEQLIRREQRIRPRGGTYLQELPCG